MLIIQPCSGLCNRMRVISSAQKFAHNRNEKLIVLWSVNEELGCPYHLLFETNDDFKVYNVKSKFNIIRLVFLIYVFFFGTFINNNLIKSNKTIDGIISDEFCQKIRKNAYIITEDNFYNCHDFSSFVPIKTLKKKINTIKAKLGYNSIGIHIRRSDHSISIQNSSTDAFISQIDHHLNLEPQTLFYLATDDESEEWTLKNRYHERIITNTNKSNTRNNIKGIQDAVIDLYTLASTRQVIGSYYSSFSETSAEISKIPLIIAK